MEKGICCAGNISVDLTYYVNTFPHEGELVHIESSGARSLGGLAANCIIDLATLDPELKLVLVGYIFLLPALDLPDETYGTKMARLLHTAKCHGLKTSIDVVSQSGADFAHVVPPALKYTDYLIINEIEAQQITGILLRDEHRLLRENMKEALLKLKEYGVTIWTIIHCPEAGFGMDEHGDFFEADSLKLPEGYIVSTTGAGDAFCSGILYAAEKEWTLDRALILGNSAAAASLRGVCGTEGMSSLNEVLQLYKLYGKG